MTRFDSNHGSVRKVLMTTDTVGGVWTYCVDLANGLAALGVEVVLAVLGPAAAAAQIEAASSASVINTGFPLDWLASATEIAATSKALASLAREIKPDLVHLNAPMFAAGGDFGVPVLGVCHSCLATWWAAVKTGPTPEDFVWRTGVQAQGLARCDALLAPSSSFAEAVFHSYGRRPGVVLNGRRDPGAGAGEIAEFLFTAGRLWDEGKNLRALDVAAGLSGLRVKAAGPVEGPGRETLRTQNLEVMGSLSPDQVRAQLSRRPIFVSTALYEPFGLAVLEAAQTGCPLVLADIPTFRELWSEAAMFVDPTDPNAIAMALKLLRGDRESAVAFGAAARARSARFSVEAMIKTTLQTYQTLVSATARAAA